MCLKKTLILVLVTLFFYSCGKEKYSIEINNEIRTFSEFPLEKKIKFKKIVEYEKGEPYSLYLSDSVIITPNSSIKKGFYFYNYSLKTNTFSTGYLEKGRGPDEALSIGSYGINGNVFWAFDKIQKKIFTEDKKKVLNNVPLNFKTFSTAKSYYNISFIDSSRYLANGDRFSLVKFEEYDLNSKQGLNKYGEFMDHNNNAPIDGVKTAYQAFLFTKPSKDKAVVAYRRTDLIEIFNLKDKSDNYAVQGPVMHDVKLKFRKNGVINIFIKNENTINSFVGGAVTDKYIYLPFSGKKRHKKNERDTNLNYSYAKQIHVYDWNGKPIKKLSFDENIMAITVSKDDKTIYAYDVDSGFLIEATINLK